MGTNYYFFTKNKELAKEYFPWYRDYKDRVDNGAELVDSPDFGYEIHLSKLSCGWRPLFQRHPNAFTTFAGLEKFYNQYKSDLRIFDEYDREYEFDEFKKEMIDHSLVEPRAIKWVYEIDKIFNDSNPSLHTVSCSPEEADLFTPFDHIEYGKTEETARKKYKVALPYWLNHNPHDDFYYDNDPDYKFDWTSGEFS